MYLAIAEAVGFERPAQAAPEAVRPEPEEPRPVLTTSRNLCRGDLTCCQCSESQLRYGQIFADLLFLYFNRLDRGQLAVTFGAHAGCYRQCQTMDALTRSLRGRRAEMAPLVSPAS